MYRRRSLRCVESCADTIRERAECARASESALSDVIAVCAGSRASSLACSNGACKGVTKALRARFCCAVSAAADSSFFSEAAVGKTGAHAFLLVSEPHSLPIRHDYTTAARQLAGIPQARASRPPLLRAPSGAPLRLLGPSRGRSLGRRAAAAWAHTKAPSFLPFLRLRGYARSPSLAAAHAAREIARLCPRANDASTLSSRFCSLQARRLPARVGKGLRAAACAARSLATLRRYDGGCLSGSSFSASFPPGQRTLLLAAHSRSRRECVSSPISAPLLCTAVFRRCERCPQLPHRGHFFQRSQAVWRHRDAYLSSFLVFAVAILVSAPQPLISVHFSRSSPYSYCRFVS